MLLDPVFRDHAVLQRERPIEVWGHAAAGAVVTVSLGSSSARARADASGRWSAALPAEPAGGPFVLTARTSSGSSQSARDVLVGDVFLCSGQSNMVLPVRRVGDSQNEIESSANETIRMATADTASSPEPLASFPRPLVWQIAGPATVPDWSAACFFFARELQQATHAPIGLLQSAVDGSRIEPWLSAAGLRARGQFLPALDLLALYARDPDAAQRKFARQWEQWWRGKTGDRPGTEPWIAGAAQPPTTGAAQPSTAGAAQPSTEGAAQPLVARAARPPAAGGKTSRRTAAEDWRPAPARLGNWQHWGVRALEDFNGLMWYRATVRLTAAQAGAAATLELGPINQIDETWVDGRALGNTFGYGAERSYRVPRGALHAGENVVVVNVSSTYEGGGLLEGGMPRALRLRGGESIPLRGWEYRAAPAAVGYPPSTPWQSVGGVTTLYNAMIAPLGHFGLRGVVWYQGESNTGEPQSYEALLTELMADWRRQLGAGMPFLIVQLPDYGPPALSPSESDWAQLREAQRLAVASDPRAALAVTLDIGEPRNLHPTDKQDVGIRLARAARHLIYGEKISPSGPIPLGAVRAAGEITVRFGDIEGRLVAYGYDEPIGFELCGSVAGACRYAEARIERDSVILRVPGGSSPTRVRYCWADSPVCTLYDLSGLPAGPFELPVRR